MAGQADAEGGDESPPHVAIAPSKDVPEPADNEHPHTLRDNKGWDGKLRVDRSALIQNPEALSDPEYSDDENVLPGDEISADEGILSRLMWCSLYPKSRSC